MWAQVLTELFNEYHQVLLERARKKLRGNVELAEEVTQATWARAVTSYEHLERKDKAAVRAWLFVILNNVIADHFRRLRNRVPFPEWDIVPDPAADHTDLLVDSPAEPLDVLGTLAPILSPKEAWTLDALVRSKGEKRHAAALVGVTPSSFQRWYDNLVSRLRSGPLGYEATHQLVQAMTETGWGALDVVHRGQLAYLRVLDLRKAVHAFHLVRSEENLAHLRAERRSFRNWAGDDFVSSLVEATAVEEFVTRYTERLFEASSESQSRFLDVLGMSIEVARRCSQGFKSSWWARSQDAGTVEAVTNWVIRRCELAHLHLGRPLLSNADCVRIFPPVVEDFRRWDAQVRALGTRQPAWVDWLAESARVEAVARLAPDGEANTSG